MSDRDAILLRLNSLTRLRAQLVKELEDVKREMAAIERQLKHDEDEGVPKE